MSSEAPAAVMPEPAWGHEPAIEVRHLTKIFELGEIASLQRTLDILRALTRRHERSHRRFAAVDDVSFEVQRGEGFALLGTNGSGKTTLLSIVTALTLPTSGEVVVRGRVTPLLSVGSAFHPELTGRENTVLFGTILGLTDREIREALPSVADFAQLTDDLMATPLKRYSEGMKARLAFATALRFPAEVVILDEVLTTADDAFKELCVEEINHQIESGTAVIFVSHELPLVRAVCRRGLLLQHGRTAALGDIDEVIAAYEPERHRAPR
jgi:lipopolysaccharide transport system ATP-binding protein